MRISFRLIATLALAATATTACNASTPASSPPPAPPQTTASQGVSTSADPSTSTAVPTASASGQTLTAAETDTPTTTQKPAPSSPSAASTGATGCDKAAIAADTKRTNITVDVCIGDWAFITSPGPGDKGEFVRRSSGTWTVYDGQPSTRCRPQAKADGVPERLLSYFRACGSGSSSAGVSGDLGLSTPTSSPSCDGSGIVILGSATRPSSYRADVAALLKAHSGAAYLRTDRSCASLRTATAAGDPIYGVYRPAGKTVQSMGAAVTQAGGDAYGKRLDSGPAAPITC